jgi:hypothetical protein
MLEYIVIAAGLALVAMYFMSGKTAPTVAPTPVPLTPATAVKSGKPRWHKYDVLLELQDCLLGAGNDEKLAKDICEKIAPLLLGERHE